MSDALEFTGERFIPGTRGEIWIEHWHRYHFAARWARGLRVLDVACGEGYGAALLAQGAAHVTGVDVSPASIEHARRAYAGVANLSFVAAACAQMPLATASFDVVVSFETLEHIHGQEDFLREIERVLKPGGVLVLSCPNRLEYSDKRAFANEFHVKELYREELAALLAARFPATAWYGQRLSFYSVIAPEGAPPRAGAFLEVAESDPLHAHPELARPLYFLIVASRAHAGTARLEPEVSVLSDRDHWFYGNYEEVIRELEDAVALRQRTEALVAERDQVIASKDAEIARRGGWRWWLKLPLYRLGILKHPPV